jgi:hypothetical protein
MVFCKQQCVLLRSCRVRCVAAYDEMCRSILSQRATVGTHILLLHLESDSRYNPGGRGKEHKDP